MLMITLTHNPTRRWCSLTGTEAERFKDHGLAPGGKQALNSVVLDRTAV